MQFYDREKKFYFEPPNFLIGASIGNPIQTRSIRTENFFSLKGYLIIIRKNTASKNPPSEIPPPKIARVDIEQ